MVKNASNQKENTQLTGNFNSILDGVLKLILILGLIFFGIWIYRKTEPKVKLDDKTNQKIVELDQSNKRIENNQKILEEKIDKYILEINENFLEHNNLKNRKLAKNYSRKH
jgi:FtsZ-interacting cell division protein ZipA